MTSIQKQKTALIMLLTGIVSFFAVPAFPADEIYLTGTLKTIDHDMRIVVVDVKSVACSGMMKFTTDDPSGLDDFIGKRIEFTIDSQRCSTSQIYTMVRGEGDR